ncbi:pheromone A receptor-domain-containing protein [Suillus paluster]|uniref:pheromone A receptor-domain-containing protein n=1 Tax=Suillus paluster TaxID=48578 RepID=UPI001B87D521|nr:pheromone A receptor-domain-containing protein [Suillus paluster]KAG1720062.1 pheromone A receptor-domain-containing protein [Suillus paluster]
MSLRMQYPSLPVAAFLAAALILVPLPWHWRARNVGTLAIIAWLFVVNMIYGINSIVWAGNVNNPAPLWCDISTKLIIGANTALPLATMCVCKHLELVASNRHVRFDHVDKRRRIIFDTIMCFGVPLLFMALHYIVQGHRYDIVENFGCQPTTYFSIEGIIIVWLPPLIFALATLVYASIALHHFIYRRMSFAAHLQNSNSALTTQRYLRLMAMAVTEITWGTALTAFNLYNNTESGLRPWISWQNVHSDWLRVDLVAFIELPPAFINNMFLVWWAMPASAYIFFLFFGFGEEARKEYRKVIIAFRRHVLRQSVKDSSVFRSNQPSLRNRPFLNVATLPSLRLVGDEKSIDEGSVSSSTVPATPLKKCGDDDYLSPTFDITPLPTYTPDLECGYPAEDATHDRLPDTSLSYRPSESSLRELPRQMSSDYSCPPLPAGAYQSSVCEDEYTSWPPRRGDDAV